MFMICSEGGIAMARHSLLQRARSLRANQTDAEGRLWGELRGRRLGGWKWRRQAPIGPFIVDFYCPAARLVVELDGSQHLDQAAYDARRTAYLERDGLRVIRFGSEGVWGGGLDYICESILAACGGETPHRPDAGASGHLSPLRGARATEMGEDY
jgi:very-short-patch-repair endonuclease